MAASRADTIFALSTPVGRSGVAVVRVSGPATQDILQSVVGGVPEPRFATLREIRDARERKIDTGLILYFPGPHSFTGEDCAEFQIHGSIAGIHALLETLGAMNGCRSAEHGEFTLRAMAEGKLDLVQVEGLADLLDAETAIQHRQSLDQLDGALSSKVEQWRSDLLRATALVEATVDFADEDVPVDVWPEVRSLVSQVSQGLADAESGFAAAEIIRNGYQVALVGPPNAGKSTLLNSIAGRDVALVSEHAGTTRDVIELRLNLGGALVTMVDLAGMRDSSDPVEAMGIQLAKDRAEKADLRIFLSEDSDWVSDVEPMEQDLFVLAKADVHRNSDVMGVSGLTGEGVAGLLRRIEDAASASVQSAGVVVRQRHVDAIRAGGSALQVASQSIDEAVVVEELVALELRRAVLALEGIVGHIGVEDMLGEIFSSFCIGK